jgi:hypothetical protein
LLQERRTVSSQEKSKIEVERRAWVERQEEFKDMQEDYDRQVAAVTNPDKRREITMQFAAARQAHRREDIALGKRSPGLGIAMRQIMWARWMEVAVEHEVEARRCFREIVAKAESDSVLREFRASLVAVTASAHTIEAVFGEIKFLIPPQPRRDKRHGELRHAFRIAFGIPDADDSRLANELAWLFELRDSAAHPYTELVPAGRHPAGINTGAEHSLFNAVTSGRAVDAAMTVIRFANAPPLPLNRWIERWVAERVNPSQGMVVDASRKLRASEPIPN